MATVSFGHTNSGTQIGNNYGPIYSAERSETLPVPSSTVPFRQDPDFVDRGSLLDEILEKAAPGARLALVGLGGVGKSQLAIEYSYRVRERSSDTWAFWIHAANLGRLEEGFWEIADRVKISDRKNPNANIFHLVHEWLIDEKKGKWTIILDNLDDSRFLHELVAVGQQRGSSGTSGRPLLTYLPISQHGSMLITSRSKSAIYSLVDDNGVVEIAPMNSPHATLLFAKKLGAPAEEIAELVTALDNMPLAIVQAATFIRKRTPRVSVSQYLKEFRKSDSNRSRLLTTDDIQLRRDVGAKNSILMTWQISFDHIKETQPLAADLLSLMSFFDRQGIPSALLRDQPIKEGDNGKSSSDDEEGNSKSNLANDFEEAIMILRHYSMISVNEDGKTFEMHRLVQLAMRKWLETHGNFKHWNGKFIKILAREFPDGNFENWAVCQPLFSHVQSAINQQPAEEGTLQAWATLNYRAAWFALTKGDTIMGQKMAFTAMKTREDLFGRHNEETIDSFEQAGIACQLRGKWKEAEGLLRHVMETRQNMLEPDNPSTLRSIANLALIYSYQGRWKKASRLELLVCKKSKQVFGPEHPETLGSVANLAFTYSKQGRWKEAEKLEMQVSETRKRVLGPKHPDTLRSFANLASAYSYQGRWTEAENLESQVLESRTQVLGSKHPDTLRSTGHLAAIHMKQGRWNEAETLQLEVLEAQRQVLGLEHPETLATTGNLAAIYLAELRLEEAENLGLQVLEIRKQTLGLRHPETLGSIQLLAMTYCAQGRWEEAEDLGLQALKTYQQVLRRNHPDTVKSIMNLGHIYYQQGRWKESEELGLQGVETCKQALGPEHPETLMNLENLACTYFQQGRWTEAENLESQV